MFAPVRENTMKKLLIILLLSLGIVPATWAFDASSITFSITSSAKTATPNLRIGIVKGALARDGNETIQAMPLPRPVNYYLTKTITHTFTTGTTGILIQVDQDTKLYVGDDLTNAILLPALTDYFFAIR